MFRDRIEMTILTFQIENILVDLLKQSVKRKVLWMHTISVI